MRTRYLLVFALALGCLFGSASIALADAPLTSPAVLQHVGFESVGDSLPVYPLDLGDQVVPAAKWGRISPRHQTGSYGLWCAGSVPASWPAYPTPTRGQAAFAATDTTNFYQSWIQFSYIEPTYGALEGYSNPFSVNWADASQSPTSPAGPWYSEPQPITPIWTTVTVPRDNVELPKTAGWFRFLFHSRPDDTSVAEGATVDDVMSTAYEFGPVGSLTATRQNSPHSTVHLAWTPAWAPSGVTPDYVVWRQDVAAPGWTQISGTRISGTSFDDPSAPVANTYQYAIQAWPGAIASDNWGVLATSPQVSAAGTTTITGTFAGSGTTTSAPYGSKLRISGSLKDIDGLSLGGMASQVVVQTSPDNNSWTTAGPTVASPAAEQGSGSYTATLTVTSSQYCRLRFGGSGGYRASTSSPSMQVSLRPAATSWQDFAPLASVKYNGWMKFSGTLVAETGSSMSGRAALVSLQSSPDNSTWTTITATIAEDSPGDSPGVYTARVDHVTQQGYYYRFAYAGETNTYARSFSAGVQVTWSQAQGLSFSAPTVSTTTPAYGGSVTLGANLTSLDAGGAVTGRTTVVVQTLDGGLPNVVTTPAIEDSPGHYTATVSGITVTAPYQLNFCFYFTQDSQYGPNTQSDPSQYVIARPANMSLRNVTASPSTPIVGQPTTVSADLITETGAFVGSSDATVRLLRSSDSSTWTTVQDNIADSPSGHYAVGVPNITSHAYFCFTVSSKNGNLLVPSASTTSAVTEVTATPSPATTISGTFSNNTTAPISVPYGALTKLTGTLRDAGGVALFGHATDVAVQSSPNGSSSWTTAGPSVASSAVESITSPGSYEVLVTTNNLTTTYYRLVFAGAGGLTASQSPYALSITGHQAVTSWTTPVLSPATIQYGDSTSVGATLTAETGPVTGRASGVTLQSSADGTSGGATVAAAVTENTSAHYRATLASPIGSRYYRFRFAGEMALAAMDSPATPLTVNAAATVWSGLPSGTVSYEFGTSSSLAGALQAQSSLGGQAGAVVLQSSPTGSVWTTAAATVTEDVPGHYSAAFVPSGTGAFYRLRYAGISGAYQTASSAQVQFASTATASGWSGASAPSSVAYDGSMTFSAVLSSTTPIPAEAGNVHLQSWNGATTWTNVAGAVVTEPSPGTYSVTLSHLRVPGAADYRLSFAGEASRYLGSDSASRTVTVTKQRTGWTNRNIDPTAAWAGITQITVSGSLEGSTDGPLIGRAVVLRSSPATDGNTWTTVTSATQDTPGHYTASVVCPADASDLLYQLAYAGSALDAASSWTAAVSVSVPTLNFAPGSVAFTPSSAWNGVTTLSAVVAIGSSATTDLGAQGQIVLEESFDAGAHTTPNLIPATGDGTGRFSASTPSGIATWYRLHFPQTPTYPDFATPWYLASPSMYLSTPNTPPKVTHNKSFAVSGQVSRTPGTRVVALRAYHKETKTVKKKKTTVWVLRATAAVRVPAGNPTSVYSYRVNMKLKQTGSWRIQAYVSDAYNPSATTGWRSFSAK